MCGRFMLTVDPGELQEAFPEFVFPAQYTPRFNIAPTQPVLVVPNDGSGRADFYTWGLIPSWAKDPSIGSRMINARAETLAEKPSFRAAYKYHRCLVLSDGFFEWQSQPGRKVKIPHCIRLKTNRPFGLAGLWEDWHAPDGSNIKSCTIITTTPNELLLPIHNRMPVILPPEVHTDWLDPNPRAPEEIQKYLVPYPAEAFTAYPVSPLVNRPENDRPEVILPLQV